MRIKQGFVMRDVAGQAVVIATGDASRDFHGMVKLNQTAAVVWHGVEQGLDVKAIAERLVAEYDVETGRALADVEALLARMREQGFVEDCHIKERLAEKDSVSRSGVLLVGLVISCRSNRRRKRPPNNRLGNHPNCRLVRRRTI